MPEEGGIAELCPAAAEVAPVPASRAPKAGGLPRSRRVDRRRVARLAAEGRTTVEIAQELGCSRQHVWRLVRNSMPLHQALNDADAEVDFNSTGRLMGLRPIVVDELARRASDGDVRVLLWLADKLKLADASAEIKSRAEMMATKKGR